MILINWILIEKFEPWSSCFTQPEKANARWYSWVSQVPRGYNTMADGGQIMRFKLDSDEIVLYN